MQISTKARQYIGHFFREKRELAKLTQGEVAKVLKLTSPQFISNVERGIAEPTAQMLGVLTKLYKLDQVQVTEVFIEAQKMAIDEIFGGFADKDASRSGLK